MGKLEDFMSKNKECWESFDRVISSKITFVPTGGGKMVKCAISGDISKIISEFFKKNKEILDNVERNWDAEDEYIDSWVATKYAALDQVKDDSIKKETEKSFYKLIAIFEILLRAKLPATSVIKQCEQQFKKRIEKYPFSDEQLLLLRQGLFFMMLIHYFAREEKAKVVAEKLAPKPQKIDSIFSNPVNGGGKNYLSDLFSFQLKPAVRRAFTFMYNYACPGIAEDAEKNIPVELTDKFCEFIKRNANRFNQVPEFNKEAQEGPHKVLLTYDNRGYDPFVDFVFGRVMGSRIGYAYYFKGSKIEDVKLHGKDTGFKVYRYPLGMPDDPSEEWLDKNLKTIWFRDVTEETKNYKKMTMKEMHEVAKDYEELLNSKVIKYIQVTYQCVGDKILVSFKTNHFDTPPVILSDADFKKVFDSPEKGTVLYRGTSIEEFESMKQEGISYNTKKHHEQYIGAGVYWDKVLEFTYKYGYITAMAITYDKLPDVIGNMIEGSRKPFRNSFVMRDNQCLVIRETAMCNETVVHPTVVEKLKKSPAANKTIVFCKTDDEVDKWKNCK